LKLELWQHPKRKHPYLIVHEGTVGNVIAQVKVSKEDFWRYMAIWLKEEFGVKVKFIVDDKEITA